VLCVDFDVDGPGLLHVLKVSPAAVVEQNVIDLLSYDRGDESASKMDISDHIIPREWTEPKNVVVDCILAPVGTERQKIVECYSGEQLEARVKTLCSQAERAGYDYLLIDSSAGFDSFTALAFAIADLVLVCFRWSVQHIAGTLKASGLLGEMLKHNHLAINSNKPREFPLKDFWLMASGVPEPKTDYHERRQHKIEKLLASQVGEIKAAGGVAGPQVEIIKVSEDDDLKWEEQVVLAGLRRPVFGQFGTVAVKLAAFADNYRQIAAHDLAD